MSPRKHRELVLALESARMRLAVAIASEAKSTPPERRKYYLDISDRARRFVKEFRKADGVLEERQEWVHAVEALKRLPDTAEALQLCRALGNIVSRWSEQTL